MNILEVITDLGSGGAERFVVDLSNELAKTNDVTLMTLMDDKVNPEHRNFNRYALNDNVNYKNSYHWNYIDSSIHSTFAGGRASSGSRCGLLSLSAGDGANVTWSHLGFTKVTILDI